MLNVSENQVLISVHLSFSLGKYCPLFTHLTEVLVELNSFMLVKCFEISGWKAFCICNVTIISGDISDDQFMDIENR